MAAAETETIEQICYSSDDWGKVARELYRHAGSRYPDHLRPFAEHVYHKALHAENVGKPAFTESVPGPDATHVRNAGRETGVEESPARDPATR